MSRVAMDTQFASQHAGTTAAILMLIVSTAEESAAVAIIATTIPNSCGSSDR